MVLEFWESALVELVALDKCEENVVTEREIRIQIKNLPTQFGGISGDSWATRLVSTFKEQHVIQEGTKIVSRSHIYEWREYDWGSTSSHQLESQTTSARNESWRWGGNSQKCKIWVHDGIPFFYINKLLPKLDLPTKFYPNWTEIDKVSYLGGFGVVGVD